jgi:hypothetical protein
MVEVSGVRCWIAKRALKDLRVGASFMVEASAARSGVAR